MVLSYVVTIYKIKIKIKKTLLSTLKSNTEDFYILANLLQFKLLRVRKRKKSCIRFI